MMSEPLDGRRMLSVNEIGKDVEKLCSWFNGLIDDIIIVGI